MPVHHRISPFRVLNAFLYAIVLLVTSSAQSQNYLKDFHNRNAELKTVQPAWITPLVMTSPLLGQFVREEFVRQRVAGGNSVWNIGNGKGFSLVPSKKTEVDLAIPNYVVHGAAAGTDGVGDFCVTTRYRFAGGNKQHGNYALTLVASQTWTTGLYKNGAAAWTRGITLAGGKAFGKFAALSTLGVTLPASSGLATMGRPIAWNSGIEMHARSRMWLLLEDDATYYKGGTHDGAKQNFLTPEVYLSPLRPWSAKSKSYVLLGVGMQFATSHYHTNDHNLVIDTKIYF